MRAAPRPFHCGAAVTVLATAIAACSQVLTRDDVLIRPAAIVPVGSTSIDATVGQVVASPARVRVVDDEGIAVANRGVLFTVSGGTVSPARATTNDGGEVAADSWTLPTSSGQATLTARVEKTDPGDPDLVATFTAQIAAGAPSTVTAQASVPSATVNTSVVVNVSVKDQYGNGVRAVRVSMQPGESGTNAAVTSDNPAITDANGVVAATWRLDTLARQNTLLVSLPDHPNLADTASAAGVAGSATRITHVTAASQAGSPGSPVATPPEVRVTDQFNNAVSGAPVTFQTATGSGTVTATNCTNQTSCQVPTGGNGQAKVTSWTLGPAMGTHTLNASVVGTSVTLSPPFTAIATRDLQMTALTAPATGIIGDSIAITSTVLNEGTMAAGAFRVAFYFSSNNIISTGDVLTGPFCSIASLAGGASTNCNMTIAVPSTISSGAWYVGAIVDDQFAVTETNESNNTRATAGTMTLSQPSPPGPPSSLAATVVSTSQIDLTWADTISNETTFRVDRCTGSTCTLFTEIASLPANTTSYQVTGLASGTTYRFRVRAVNAGGSSAASSIVTATTLVAGIDLTVPTLTAPSSGITGSTITVTSSVQNLGSSASGAFRVGFYFSTNSLISLADTYSGSSCSFTNLNAGSSAPCNIAVTVPSSLAPGTYYVGALADDLGAVVETNESNNYGVSANTTVISSGIPSAPTSLTVSAVWTDQSRLDLAWTDNSANETGFRIERCLNAFCSTFVEIATVGANVTSFSNTGLGALIYATYRVRAYSSFGNSTYSNSASAVTRGNLSLGATVNQSLVGAEQSNPLRAGSYYHDYQFTLASGRTVQLDLTSTSYDTYLFLLDASGNLIESDDDGGGGTNSRIIRLLAAGTYTVRASTFSGGVTGAYQLVMAP